MSRAVAVTVPAHLGGLTGLTPVDYHDAFAVQTPVRRTAEEWARLIVEGAPPLVRGFVLRVHRALGFRLASPGSARHIVGWEILRDGPEEIVLGVEGGIVTPRIVVFTSPGQVVAATLIRFDRPGARAVWAVLAPMHRAVARYLLSRAANVRWTHP